MENTEVIKTKRGRPSKYSPKLAAQICELIESGASDAQVCKKFGIVFQTLDNWRNAYPEFLEQSIRARRISADVWNKKREDITAQLQEIAANALATGEPVPKGVVEALNVAARECARSASIRDDSRYGDRKKLQISGEKDAPPVAVDLSGVSTENLKKARELLYGSADNPKPD